MSDELQSGCLMEGFLALRERSRLNGNRCEYGVSGMYDAPSRYWFAVCPPCGWCGPYRYTTEATARDFTVHSGRCPLCDEDDWDTGHRSIDPLPCALVLSDTPHEEGGEQ